MKKNYEEKLREKNPLNKIIDDGSKEHEAIVIDGVVVAITTTKKINYDED